LFIYCYAPWLLFLVCLTTSCRVIYVVCLLLFLFLHHGFHSHPSLSGYTLDSLAFALFRIDTLLDFSRRSSHVSRFALPLAMNIVSRENDSLVALLRLAIILLCETPNVRKVVPNIATSTMGISYRSFQLPSKSKQ